MKKSIKIIQICIAVAAVVLTVVGFFILPDTLVMQITSGGAEGNTMPKWIGLLVPLAIVGISLLWSRDDETGYKSFIVSAVGLVAYVLIYIFNL